MSASRRPRDSAPPAVVEPLEGRLFLHGGVSDGDGVLIDVGSKKAITAHDGHKWDRDRYASGGRTVAASKKLHVTRTTDDALYASYRRGKSFRYAVPLDSGTYAVTLRFTEPTERKTGKRLFDVKAENRLFVDDLDLVKQTGGGRRAYDATFSVDVIDGKLNLEFKARKGEAIVSGIGVHLVPPTQPAPDPAPTPDPAPAPDPDPSPNPNPNPAPAPLSTTVNWTRGANHPENVGEASAVAIGGKMYVFGGYSTISPRWQATARADVYDPAANKWTRIADLPARLTHMGVATDGTYAYVAGGYLTNDAGYQIFGQTGVFRYDPAANKWSALTPLPEPRGGGGLAYLDGKLHFVAGSDAVRADRTEHWTLDPATPNAAWQTAKAMPVARSHIGFVPLGGKLYVAGGETGHDEGSISSANTFRYDPATDTWTELAKMPLAVSHTNGSLFTADDGRIFAVGGDTDTQFVNTVFAYDPAADAWATCTPLPAAGRTAVSAVMVGGRIIATGGFNVGLLQETWIGQLV